MPIEMYRDVEKLLSEGMDLDRAIDIISEKWQISARHLRGEFDESYRLAQQHEI